MLGVIPPDQIRNVQENPPGEVVTAARSERDDNAHGLARKLLGENGGGRQQR